MGHITTAAPLARDDPADHAAARRHLDDLLRAARAVALAVRHTPADATCAGAGCALAAVPAGPELCGLAHSLAPLAGDGPVERRGTDPAVAAFRRALVDALDAVRACRQTAHQEGACWFAAGPGVDGCAEVLRLAHRLG
jgi:hypothetical protein